MDGDRDLGGPIVPITTGGVDRRSLDRLLSILDRWSVPAGRFRFEIDEQALVDAGPSGRAWCRDLDGAGAGPGDAARAGLETGDAAREPVWMEVVRCEAGGVAGRPVDEAEAGDTWLDLEHVSDWRVITGQGAIGPAQARELEAAAEGACR